jgi:epoxyqueuosine reductase
MTDIDYYSLATEIKAHSKMLGFDGLGITDIELSKADAQLQIWLDKKFHGSMAYLEKNRHFRRNPAELVPGTTRVISVRLNYLPQNAAPIKAVLGDSSLAYISRYALGRDYHRIIRNRLKKLAEFIQQKAEGFPLIYRPFADSAPVFEKPLAQKSGLGWMGKNTLILNREAGSWFFLGVLYTNLPLPLDEPTSEHCGKCTACIDICPTQAIVGPYQLDARRCISYLTIENKGPIPIEFRPLIGNRIFGCDDCQLVCPWNKFAKYTKEMGLLARHELDQRSLIDLFNWTEAEFLKKTEGSAIRRAGYLGWLRNIAVALGNSKDCTEQIREALKAKADHPSELVRSHVEWALQKLGSTFLVEA